MAVRQISYVFNVCNNVSMNNLTYGSYGLSVYFAAPFERI